MAKSWEVPDGSRSVIFADGVLPGLTGRVVEALHAVPRRGAETGGLLFGRVLRQQPLLARITGFEEVPCAHRFGPTYILSEEEMASLGVLLHRAEPDPVIGFFRSYTSREMVLDEIDRNLLGKYFPAAGPVILLLQPHPAGDCTARFVFPESGSGWETEYPSFDVAALPDLGAMPLAEAPLPPAAPETAAVAEPALAPSADPVFAESERIPAAAPERIPALAPMTAAGAVPRRDTTAPSKLRFLFPTLGWILLFVAAAAISVLWNMTRAPHWAPLRLDAQLSTTGAIALTWDGSSAAAREASRGVLGIEDAAGSRNVELSPAQVHSGQYTYFPHAAGNDSAVLFRLEFFGSTLGAAGDSLRVVARPQTLAPEQPKPKPERREESADRVTSRATAGPPVTSIAVLPEPLREIHPDIPVGIRARITDRIVIPVEVKVTANGRVTGASAKGSGDDLYHYLAGRSAQAARQWRFSPARSRTGRPVAAVRTVYFVFTGR